MRSEKKLKEDNFTTHFPFNAKGDNSTMKIIFIMARLSYLDATGNFETVSCMAFHANFLANSTD